MREAAKRIQATLQAALNEPRIRVHWVGSLDSFALVLSGFACPMWLGPEYAGEWTPEQHAHALDRAQWLITAEDWDIDPKTIQELLREFVVFQRKRARAR